MKIIHVNQSDTIGGAARAAYRIHRSLVDSCMNSHMRVLRKDSDDASVTGGFGRNSSKIARFVAGRIAARAHRNFRPADQSLHSVASCSSGLAKEINSAAPDVVHLHWTTGGALSVEEIGRLAGPVVWTLHDMWGFSGAEHYTDDGPTSRFRVGYYKSNVPAEESSNDLNRSTWNRKVKNWTRPFHIVAPSRWLAECAKVSRLFATWPVTVIPYPIDLDVWRPLQKQVARELLGLDPEANVVLMGAFGGLADPRKGGDLAIAALKSLVGTDCKADQLLVFGQSAAAPHSAESFPLPTRFLGRIYDDLTMVIAYSAADVMLVPSRQDNLPNTAIEALACGTPVVGFSVGGMTDIVQHGDTGWLAKPFDIADLAAGISWALSRKGTDCELRRRCRDSAVAKFSPNEVAMQYVNVYREVCNGRR